MFFWKKTTPFLLLMACCSALLSCSDNSVEENTETSKKDSTQKSSSQVASVQPSPQPAQKPEIQMPKVELKEISAGLNLDPCQLLTTSELNEIGLPTDQHIAQLAGSRQLPNHSPITPFIGCKWRSVDAGTPVGWVYIQQLKGEFTLEGQEQFDLADGAWKASSQGRDQLIVKSKDRLIMVTTQIPYNEKSEMESNLWIANKVLSRLQQVTDTTELKAADATFVGGPSFDICSASRPANPQQLLQGDTAWSFPNVEVNGVPSQNKRPQEDGVSCVYSSNRRGGIHVSYFGSDGTKRWNQHFAKNGEKITFNSMDAYRDKRNLFVPLAQGSIMVEAQGIKYFSDQEIIQKVDEIAAMVLKRINE
ncbi:hypothetical protein [Pleionea litopenaei]|uniref:Uncharacterized protein n=1 Tax=Pleionea litopenaei TaxID=3070815 RepID=A0AA51RSJ5_9GAMM|nr:hypothetical protein [Pleionea sp. HL-JVS1]WMS86821.1 hypothetical protein Q9312_16495 [Pleionea sp. HL-JVS1]